MTAAALSVAFVIAFAQVYNDIVDRFLDRRDKPDRPLPSGRISVSSASLVAAVCAAVGIALAVVVGPLLAAYALLVVVLSWAYSRYWKSTILFGNLVVALLASSTVPYGAAASGGQLSTYLLWVQLTVLSVVFAHEIVKTVRDVEGDAAAGTVTVATRFGVSRAARCAAFIGVVSVAVALVPALYTQRPGFYLAVAAGGLILPTLWAVWLLARKVHVVRDVATPFQILRFAWGGMVLALLVL